MVIVVALIGLAAVVIAYLAVGWQWALITLLAYVLVLIYGQRRDWRGAFAWCLLLSFFGIAVTGGLFAHSIEDSIPSFLLGAAIATLAYVAAATMMFAACTEIYIVWRGADRTRAWRMAFGFILSAVLPGGMLNPIARMFRGIQVVTDGQVSYSLPRSESDRMLGPVMLVVHVGNAVVLDQTGQITRIVGPGFYTTEPFETIYSVVDLQPQTAELQVERVLTKDSIPLRIRFTVLYQIKSDQAALLTRGLFRIDQDAIRRAVLCTTDRDWGGYTESVARNTLCDTIASRYLDEIYDPRGLTPGAPRVPLQHTLRRKLSQEAQGWGVEIIRITLDEISMPNEVSQRMIEAWDVNWRHVVELARAITDARTIVTAASGAGQAARITAQEEALARLEAAGIDGGASLIEAVGAQRLARLAAAQADRDIAQVEADTARIKARGRADASRIERRVETELEADRFRTVLSTLQQIVGDELMKQMTQELVRVLTSVNDVQAFLRVMRWDRRALPSPQGEGQVGAGAGQAGEDAP